MSSVLDRNSKHDENKKGRNDIKVRGMKENRPDDERPQCCTRIGVLFNPSFVTDADITYFIYIASTAINKKEGSI